MNWKNTADRYGSFSIGMHWIMLLLLLGVYACIELRELYPRGSDLREALKTWHFMLGLSVFVLVFARLSFRAGPKPGIVPAVPAWQEWSALAMHAALYTFMVAMPLLGWLALSAAGKPIPFFGISVPPLIAPDSALAALTEEVHETVGTLGYYLIGLHAAAALFHHYAIRDNTLRRMLPWRSRRAARNLRRVGMKP